MSDNGYINPLDMLKIISAYANTGANPNQLANLYEVLNMNFPYKEKESNKEKEIEYKDITTRILKIISGKQERIRNITDDVRDYIKEAEGEFSLAQMFSILGIVTKEGKDLGRHAVRNEVNDGVIEPIGKKTGIYRKVDKTLVKMNLISRQVDEFPIVWPLGLHNLVKIMKKNIVVLAGSSNAGKTTFLFETIRLNRKHHNIDYFCSEGGEDEIIERLRLFNPVWAEDDWGFNAWERDSNFADVINPDGFNIIDFMEVYDEDYVKIGRWIRDIYRKLATGIVIIAIQKKSNTKKDEFDYSRGGETTLEKPRLYLAMDKGRLKIVKAKWFRNHGQSPNGMVRHWHLVDGWKFLPTGEWQNETDEKYQSYKSKKDNEFEGFIPEVEE